MTCPCGSPARPGKKMCLECARNGQVKIMDNGEVMRGPFTMQARQQILDRLLGLQAEIGRQLITEDEINACKLLDLHGRREGQERAGHKLTAVLVAAEDTAKSYLATSLRLERERDAARAEIRRLTELRPIAEAPRDGTWVLGIAPGYGRPVAVRWDSDRWAADSDADEYQITIEPTHFLPLSDGMPR